MMLEVGISKFSGQIVILFFIDNVKSYKTTDYSNYMCSEMSRKVASRITGVNQNEAIPTTTK